MSEEVVPNKKKSVKKTLLITAIVLVVMVGGVAGTYAVLHDDPGFCNALCHSPMDPYVASYEQGISIKKDQSSAVLLVARHKESAADINCLSCHEPSFEEQIAEGMKWISGEFNEPLKPLRYDGKEFCLRPECHEGIETEDDLARATENLEFNPHDSHMPDLACDQCHQVHEQSEMMCRQCHSGAELPAGWKEP
ncbi:MAG: cytochrome c3 family protein [Coriobacteriales bacterium]|jgi:hypothetical protein|nr:cytochrome c3 family protein [Coriobacteriales bacterium]